MRMCSRCVMDESDPEIIFDAHDVCNHCTKARILNSELHTNLHVYENQIYRELLSIKEQNNGNKYDGIVGLSGGVDSSYLVHFLKQKGLRPLVVHVDAGWNSIESVENIYTLVEALGLDLETRIINWEVMRKLHLAYLKSGVLNQDVPQDHAFFASIYEIAIKMGIRDVFLGSNIASESILPKSWGQFAMDGKNLRDIYKHEYLEDITDFPVCSINWIIRNVEFGSKIKIHKPLNYIEYNKDIAKKFLMNEYQYKDYGDKHSESTFTSYYQKIYLPNRARIDKRKAYLSSLIVSGQLERDEALELLNSEPSNPVQERNLRSYVASKLRIEEAQLLELEKLPLKSYKDFKHSIVGMFILKTIYKARILVSQVKKNEP